MFWFKSNYDKNIEAYSPNWYGTMSYAPSATVLMYDDGKGLCVGYMDANDCIDVTYLTESEANALLDIIDGTDPLVWNGDRLVSRWDTILIADEIIEEVQ